jgi:hypothetical protein
MPNSSRIKSSEATLEEFQNAIARLSIPIAYCIYVSLSNMSPFLRSSILRLCLLSWGTPCYKLLRECLEVRRRVIPIHVKLNKLLKD